MELLEIHIMMQKNIKDKIEFWFINKNNSKFSQQIELPEKQVILLLRVIFLVFLYAYLTQVIQLLMNNSDICK